MMDWIMDWMYEYPRIYSTIDKNEAVDERENIE
jgi:hypothetical protein